MAGKIRRSRATRRIDRTSLPGSACESMRPRRTASAGIAGEGDGTAHSGEGEVGAVGRDEKVLEHGESFLLCVLSVPAGRGVDAIDRVCVPVPGGGWAVLFAAEPEIIAGENAGWRGRRLVDLAEALRPDDGAWVVGHAR